MKTLKSKKGYRALHAFSVCLFFAYLLPYHVAPFRSFYNDWLAIFGVFIVFVYSIEERAADIQIPWIIFVPLGVIAIIVLQTFAGMLNQNWDAFLPVAYLLVVTLAIVLGANITSNGDGFSNLWGALSQAHLIAGLVSVLIASLQLAGGEIPFVPFMMLMSHSNGVQVRPYANLGQTNQLALLFCLAMVSVWWLFQAQRIRTNMAIAAVMMLLWGLALTQSRIGWIIMPLFVAVIWMWHGKRGFRAIPRWLTIVFLIAYAMFEAVILPTLSSMLDASIPSITDRVTGPSVRMVLFRQALQMSLSNPWFGVGWFQFGPQQLALAPAFPAAEYSNHAHNILLNFAAEIGWPATLVIVMVVIFWFVQMYYQPITKEIGASLLFLSAVLVHSLVEYPLWYAYVLMPVGMLLGAVHYQQLGTLRVIVLRPYLWIMVVVMASTLVGVAADYRRVVRGFWQMDMESMGLTMNMHAEEIPAVTVFPYVYDFFKFMHTEIYEGMPASEIASLEKTSRRFSGPQVLARMSQVYALNHRDKDAINMILAVQRLHGSLHYEEVYEGWRHAPQTYQHIFKQLPPPIHTK